MSRNLFLQFIYLRVVPQRLKMVIFVLRSSFLLLMVEFLCPTSMKRKPTKCQQTRETKPTKTLGASACFVSGYLRHRRHFFGQIPAQTSSGGLFSKLYEWGESDRERGEHSSSCRVVHILTFPHPDQKSGLSRRNRWIHGPDTTEGMWRSLPHSRIKTVVLIPMFYWGGINSNSYWTKDKVQTLLKGTHHLPSFRAKITLSWKSWAVLIKPWK